GAPDQHADWFAATIGGLGLTGMIRTARLQMRRVPGEWIAGDSQRFDSLQEFFALAAQSDADYEYTVAWLDCAASGAKLGRGVFMRGNHVQHDARPPRARSLRFPVTAPVSSVTGLSVRLFNELYFHRPAAQQPHAIWHYQPF